MAAALQIHLQWRNSARASEVTAAIILAAGASSRIGTPKANLPFRGGTFLSHLNAKLAAHCRPVVTVTGAHTLPAFGPQVHNPNWQQGQLTSLQCGLRAIPGATSALFTLVDHPDPAGETIQRLLASQALIAIPVHNGQKGHPVFFQASLFAAMLALPASASAKELFQQHLASTEYIPVADPGILDDVDDPESLSRFRLRTESA